MTRLILVRHGESEANEKGLFVGHTDSPLSKRGIKQAEKTAEYIVNKWKIDVIYSSDLKRAYDTALSISKRGGVDIISDERLREIYGGDWEGEVFTELSEKFPEDRALWRTDIANSRCTNGESVRELSKRINERLVEIARDNDGKTVVVTTHATPIGCMLALWKMRDIEKMKDIRWVDNASVTVIEYENEAFTVLSTGERAHLENI